MTTREPIFEKSRSVEDLERMRLMALLRELARDKGVKEAAQALDVDHRTLIASLDGRELSRRVRVALEKALRAFSLGLSQQLMSQDRGR